MSLGEERAVQIARSFVAARAARTAFADYPGEPPVDLAAAYAVQDAAIALSDCAIGGWKVGRVNPPVEGIDRLAGPIFADQIVTADSGAPVGMPVFEHGFAAAEAEFLMRLRASPDPDQRNFTIDDARALVDSVCVGIEVASSPYAGINDDGPAVTISDFGNNNGLVVGPAIADWNAVDLCAWPVTLSINGATIGSATAATMLDGPFGAVRFLLENLAGRGIALMAGQWISTGAVTGVHRVAVGDRIEARFDDRMTVECAITA